ncbi:MBOAT family O-acyltransferase [Xylanibacter muris]|nr:MBOAT family O-acyltransferase [Xylanibacter muris]
MANVLLLVISYGLYMQWKPVFALVLLGVTVITYSFAIIIEKKKAFGCKKYLIYSGILLALLPLLIFKYANFVNEILTNVVGGGNLKGLNWAIPLGISFFTFQAIGYLWDVYYRRIRAEHNLIDYMLFVSFFPQIMSGPISKAKDLLPQIKAEREFDYGKAVQGLKWILWGMFMKVVLADRLGMYVDTVFNNYEYHSGISCFAASICYTFQIYADFAGYSLMAIGVGRLMGFELINNFNRPYFSVSITEFWHRWHISLSTWLKDYIYIPLGGSRCSKLRNYWNIFVTFLVSGIWHGANWTFVIWGVMHGVFQILEKASGLQKCDRKSGVVMASRILVTFILVNFAWIFFRMPTVNDAIGYIMRIFTEQGHLYSNVGVSVVVFFLPWIMLIVSEFRDEYFPGKFLLLNSKYSFIRWCSYVTLTIMIILFGVLDSGQFIYVSF